MSFAVQDFNASEKNNDEAFNETEWWDFTHSSKLQKRVILTFSSRIIKGKLHLCHFYIFDNDFPPLQWPYRSRSLCCAMCKYSTQNLYTFRNHVTRCHSYMKAMCALASCPQCVFTGHPRVVKKHMLLFHSKVPVQTQPSVVPRLTERYQCVRCSFPSSSIFAMKKHVILKHLEHLAETYIGYTLNVQGRVAVKVYRCKVCLMNTGNLDQMLHHMLVEPSHYAVSTQVQSLIYENKNYTVKSVPNGNSLFVTLPSIAPKSQQQPQLLNSKSLVLPSNGQAAGTVVALQQLQGGGNAATLICTPGTNQTAFLPPQASALVQLASAEAKGLLQPGATIALRSALPQGPSMVQLPTLSNVSLKPTQVALSPAQPQPSQNAPQILLPSGLQATVAGASTVAATAAAPKTATVLAQGAASNQLALKGTMLTSQSLLSHLIPTGNKVNGLPTYTFAPLQVAVPAALGSPLKPVAQPTATVPQTKKWITCPFCNELFPSNVFDMHTEVAHQTKAASSRAESVAARASFLKKMPDKTLKCLTCRVQLSDKNVFQHLLHGLSCLYCSSSFYSIKHLIEHVKQHASKYCSKELFYNTLRSKFGLYSNGAAGLLFPYVDINATSPKEILGDVEVSLALISNSLEPVYLKLQPGSQPEICPAAPAKISSSFCPFCNEKFLSEAQHLEHLKQKHFVAPTIHAVLKTEAFKCVYCNGVYTGKVTQQAVMLHMQRCRCSPKQQPLKITAPAPPPVPPSQLQPQHPPKPTAQLAQTSGLYFLQVPQGMTVKQTLAPAGLSTPAVSAALEAEQKSKKRLEAALKEVMEANKREREQQAAVRRMRKQEKPALAPAALPPVLLPPPTPRLLQPKPPAAPAAVVAAAVVPLSSRSLGVRLPPKPKVPRNRASEKRKDFISTFFNRNPYATKAECEELCRQVALSKSELAAQFVNKRSRCMKSLRRSKTAVLLGFNMTEVAKVKHNLLIPKLQAAGEQPQGNPRPAPRSAPRSAGGGKGNAKVPNGEPVGQME